MSHEGFGREDDDGLGSVDVLVLVAGALAFALVGDHFERVEDGDEVCEGFACSVISVDDDTQIAQVLLESDGQ